MSEDLNECIFCHGHQLLWNTLRPTETGEISKTITIWVRLQSNDNLFLGAEYVDGI